jgi:hypothetical protein
MQTLRRWYLYAAAFVSLETVLWGVIGLARAFIAGVQAQEGSELLAGGLALILVGAPVFFLHGWLAQRSAMQDSDERFARTRAFFFYSALLATLIPVSQNILAILNRLFLGLFNQPIREGLLGSEQTASDNVIAIAINLAAAAGLYYLLRGDWQARPKGQPFPETRRLYRLLWVAYALILALPGMLMIFNYLLTVGLPRANPDASQMANGLALAMVGIPLWVFTHRLSKRSWSEAAENLSHLRRSALLQIIFICAIGALVAAMNFSSALLYLATQIIARWPVGWDDLWRRLAEALAIAIPFGLVWWVYERALRPDLPSRAIPPQEDTLFQYRAGLQRAHHYGLAFLGMLWMIFGLYNLISSIITLTVGQTALTPQNIARDITAAAAAALSGFPLWFNTFLPAQRQTAKDNPEGNQARRSVVRRGYLFLLIFIGLIGVMAGTGALIYELLRIVLGNAPLNPLFNILDAIGLMGVFSALLITHGLLLRQDNRSAQRLLSRQHTHFPVLILAPDDDSFGDSFADSLVNALKQQAPALPVAVHRYRQGAPDETLSAARAVIAPAELLAQPEEALRLWLQAFDGQRVIIPGDATGWVWAWGKLPGIQVMARQAAQIVRRMAEEE